MSKPPAAMIRRLLGLGLLAAWEAVARLGWVPELLLPAPSRVFAVIWNDFSVYLEALWVTLMEIAGAMAISCGLGITVGAMIGGIAALHRLLLPVFSSLYAIPIVILYPVFTAWFGIGPEAKSIFGGAYGFFPVMLSTAAGVLTIEPHYLLAARSMGATLAQRIVHVILPASLPVVLAGLRLGGALAIIGVVFAEMLTAAAGLGYLVTLNRTLLDSPRVFASIIVILILAIAFDLGSRRLERRLLRWKSKV